MAGDDWRVRIELEDEADKRSFLDHLQGELGEEGRKLAEELAGQHLAVSRDEEELFVYAATRAQTRRAREVIEAELAGHGVKAKVSRVEQWLDEEQRWDDEPAEETWEEELIERGFAPWEVRVSCESRGRAKDLAEQLEREGYRPVRRWRYLVVGTDTREDAEKLAKRLHGEVELSGEVVWEEATGPRGAVNPFSFFG
jgi:hypothetical protein